MPKTRKAFWEEKFVKNIERDKKKLSELEHLGWECLIIWECQTKKSDELRSKVCRFLG